MISNKEIAKILREIGEILEVKEVEFKPRAYQKASQAIRGLEDNAYDIYEEGGIEALKDISGVGESIAEKIEEIIKTGDLEYYEKLKEEFPVDIDELVQIEGVGPKTAFKLYNELGIKNVEALKEAAESQKIREVEGFGEKSEENILKGIKFLEKSRERFILGYQMPMIRDVKSRLEKINGVERVTVAGSTRRKRETIGDVDILVLTENPERVMDYFVDMPEVVHIYSHGKTKSSVKTKSGIDIDIRIVPEKSYGSALNYFTGSKDHNVKLREIAIKKGYKLNEYGLFKGEKQIAGETEEGLYKKMGLSYIEPELRENTGEIEASKENNLPNLIEYGDLRGDLQIQTDWSDGNDSIEDMARQAMEEGLDYIAITDHTKNLAMANGLDEKRIQKQWEEIDKVNKKLKDEEKDFQILKSSECDILKNGSMDLSDEILAKLDIVGGAVHSHFNLSKEEQTERIIKAMENPNVDIIFHPTGRVLHKREPYDLDIEKIIKKAKETKTILEINAFPDRLDLKDVYIKKCVEEGLKMSISSDAHSKTHIKYLEYGVAQARRGWAKKGDIINAWPVDKMLKFIKD